MELTNFKIGTLVADYALDENFRYIEPNIPIIGVVTDVRLDEWSGSYMPNRIQWMDEHDDSTDTDIAYETAVSFRELYEQLVRDGTIEDVEKRT